MTQPVDGYEMLERIRGARDWADTEATRLDAADAPEAATYRAIRDTLDHILDPTHP